MYYYTILLLSMLLIACTIYVVYTMLLYSYILLLLVYYYYFLNIKFFFKNPHPRSCLLILEREEGKKREREREKERGHRCERETSSVASCVHPDQGLNLQTRYVPWPGIKLPTFLCTGWRSNQLSHSARAILLLVCNITHYHPNFHI